MDCEFLVCARRLRLKEDPLPSGPGYRRLTATLTTFHGADKAALDLEGWKPAPRFRVVGNGHQNIDHRDCEAALDRPEVVLEGRMRREVKDHPTCIKICLVHRERRESRTVWRGLADQEALEVLRSRHVYAPESDDQGLR